MLRRKKLAVLGQAAHTATTPPSTRREQRQARAHRHDADYASSADSDFTHPGTGRPGRSLRQVPRTSSRPATSTHLGFHYFSSLGYLGAVKK